MQYSTVDYLRDSNVLLDKTFENYFFYKPLVKIWSLKLKLKFFSVNWRKYIKNTKANLAYGVTILFLGFLAVTTLFSYTEKSEGLRVVTLTSGSMSPKIPIASIVVTIPSNIYKKGDIVTYKEVSQETGVEFDRTITHRIVDVIKTESGSSFILKGDANENPDPEEVSTEQILGKIFLILPFAGYLTIILKTFPGFLLLIAIPCYLIVRNEVNYLKKEIFKFIPL